MGTFDVRDERGVIVANAKAGLVRKGFARRFCESVEHSAAPYGGEASLVMDMSALSKATPPAALYAIKRMREIPLRHIAIVGGNGFMRGLGKFVLTVGRFPSFGFFPRHAEALAWLERVGAGVRPPG